MNFHTRAVLVVAALTGSIYASVSPTLSSSGNDHASKAVRPRSSSTAILSRSETQAGSSNLCTSNKQCDVDNQRVIPGKVKWHKNLQAACDAAKLSHRPVLLFQMLGQLDEKYC